MLNWLKRNLPASILRKRWTDYYWQEFNGDGEPELRQLPTLVPEDKIAVDIGGSVGTYTFHLSRLAKQVVTFEPNPQLHYRYEKLAIPNVRLERVALTDTDGGTTELAIPDNIEQSGLASIEPSVRDKHSDFNRVTVPLRTLDSFELNDIGFVKIDVEGHEESVLRGAQETIARNRPTFLIEIEERHNEGGLQRIVDMFSGLGYSTYYFDAGEQYPYSEFSLETHQTGDAAAAAGKYINNFIFKYEAS